MTHGSAARFKSSFRGMLCGSAFAIIASTAAGADEKSGAARNVLLFDKLCYEMLPDLAKLQAHAAKLKWEPITGRRLQGFKPAAPPKVLQAWAFKDLGLGFQIAITHSDMDEQSKKDFPDFAKGQAYACSLILPAKFQRAQISEAMKKLMGRKADESSDQGRLKFDTWNGKDKTRQVIINHMGAKNGGPGGMLSITLMIMQ